ncbi:MAG: pyruvate kinase [Nitrospirota bacterium]|nr:pyruvate kinase [Nitrospirota bacterium]
MRKRTKIVATIGPATSSPAMIAMLIRAGMDVVRLNFSHGDRKAHSERIRLVRREAKRLGRHIAIIQDLQGPKLRVGRMKNDAVLLERGAFVTLTTKNVVGTKRLISITYPRLTGDLKPNDTVLLDDGRLTLTVMERGRDTIECVVVRGGVLKSHKGVNMPGARLTLPSLSRKDKDDLRFGIAQGVDYVALSFVRTADDVQAAQRFIRVAGAGIPVIAKIEKPEAIRNLAEIIAAADGIMIARGDLGVEMSPEEVPLLQKRIILACNEAEKPVITATQMLESMIEAPQPTRAEASDVANAILDGTDCVMLSGETAVGKHPVLAVEVMARIAAHAETSLTQLPPDKHIGGIGESIAHAACRAAQEQQARAIVTFTQSGSTALLVSKHRPDADIIAPTPFERVARKVALYWGVIPVILKPRRTTDAMIMSVERIMLKKRLARKHDLIVLTAGVPIGVAGSTNMMKVHRVGETSGLESRS